MKMTPTTFLMARVSTQHQADEGEGLAAQLAAVQKAADRLDLPNQKPTPEVISGFTENLEDRPELMGVLKKARPGDVMVWDKSDRIARDKTAKEAILNVMAKAGVRCVVGGTEYDLTNEEHRLILTLFGGFDHYMGRALVARMKAGKEARERKGGLVNVTPCFGLAYDPGGSWQERTFRIVEDQARIVREIFDRYLRGQSQDTIAECLQAAGAKTTRGRNWTGPRVGDVLRNPLVAGRVYSQMYYYTGAKRLRHRNPRSEWQLVKTFDAVISWDVWERVQDRLQANRPAGGKGGPGRPADPKHFLKDHLTCGECGGGMGLVGGTKQANGEYAKYHKCLWARTARRSKLRGKRRCKMPGVLTDHAEAIVWRAVRRVFLNPAAFLSRFMRPDAATAEKHRAAKAAEKAAAMLANITAKIERAANLLLSADAARTETLNNQLVKMEGERDALRVEVVELTDRMKALADTARSMSFLQDNAATIGAIQTVARKTVDSLDAEQRKELVDATLSGLGFRVVRVPEKEWQGLYRQSPSGRFGIRMSPLPTGLPVHGSCNTKEVVRAAVMEAQLSPLASITNVAVAFDGRSKAAGEAYRLEPVGTYKPGHALADLARLAKAIKPRVFAAIEKKLFVRAGRVTSESGTPPQPGFCDSEK